MKVLMKNVFWSEKHRCTKKSTQIDETGYHKELESKLLKEFFPVVKVGPNDYRNAIDLYFISKKHNHFISKSAILKIDMPIYHLEPNHAGEIFIKNLSPMFEDSKNNEKINLVNIMMFTKLYKTAFEGEPYEP